MDYWDADYASQKLRTPSRNCITINFAKNDQHVKSRTEFGHAEKEPLENTLVMPMRGCNYYENNDTAFAGDKSHDNTISADEWEHVSTDPDYEGGTLCIANMSGSGRGQDLSRISRSPHMVWNAHRSITEFAQRSSCLFRMRSRAFAYQEVGKFGGSRNTDIFVVATSHDKLQPSRPSRHICS